MEIGALAPYELALRTAQPLTLRTVDGDVIELEVGRWLAGVDAADTTVLARARGPVLDVGCGPGRFVAELAGRGVPALGLDIAETAVALTRDQGGAALLRSVFADVPGEGRWPTVLLMDGNVGIGGDPHRLVRRAAGLLAPGGRLIVEAHPDRHRDETLDVCFAEGARPVGPSFGWAHVGRDALRRYARRAGARVVDEWTAEGRSFVAMARR